MPYTLSELDDSDPTALDVAPIVYDVGPVPRRASSHGTMGGDRVHQDFGAPGADRQINLRTEWMEEATLDDFQEKFATAGAAWKWVDGLGGEYSVFFRALRADRIRGYAAYQVEITFDILEVL